MSEQQQVVAFIIWQVVICTLLAVMAFAVLRRRRARRRARRLFEARVKAEALVIGFEHTPVRGASRDRSLSGKARRRARQQR